MRGQVIVENDELVGKPGDGQFVKRATRRRGAAHAVGRVGLNGGGDERRRGTPGLRRGAARAERHARRAAGGARRRLLVRLHRPGVRARLRPLGRGRGDEAAARRRAGEGPAGDLHDDRLRAVAEGRRPLGAEGAGAGRPPARRPLGRDRPAARAARRRDDRAQEGRVGVLRHEPRLDPRVAGRSTR